MADECDLLIEDDGDCERPAIGSVDVRPASWMEGRPFYYCSAEHKRRMVADLRALGFLVVES